MINIHMTEECYNKLLELSKTQKEEVGGIIQGKANGNDLLVDKISIPVSYTHLSTYEVLYR